MAGYYGYSKSWNAIEAENNHIHPMTTLKRLYGVKGSPSRRCEWHHTSKEYNRTDYYDARNVMRTRDLRDWSNKRPSDEHLYNRLVVKREMIDDAAGFSRFAVMKDRLDYVISEWSKIIDQKNFVELRKKIQAENEKRAAAEVSRNAAMRAELESSARTPAASGSSSSTRRSRGSSARYSITTPAAATLLRYNLLTSPNRTPKP